ncbi:AI-2E family transporter [bacterium]|nr:AI-2E family transporter [bacterium]
MELSKRFRYLTIISIIVVILGLLYKFRGTLPIFIMALLLAFILTPVVTWMSSKRIFNRRISRGLSIIIIYLFLITGLSFGGAYFVINLTNEVQILVKDIPSYGEQLSKNWVPSISKGIQNVAKYLPKLDTTRTKTVETEEEKSKSSKVVSRSKAKNEILDFLSNTRFLVKQDKTGFEIIPQPISTDKENVDLKEFDLAKVIDNFIESIIENLQSILLGFLNYGQIIIFSVVTSVFQTFITLMIAAFIIVDHEAILAFFLGLFPKRFATSVELFLQKQNAGLAGVVRGQMIICLVNGTLTGIGLFVLDVKFALTLSLVATVCSLIPVFGVIISSIPILMMAITNSFFTAVLSLGWILIIHFIEGNILNPKIIGKSAEIHPVLVILALMAGQNAYGIFGALIAVPLFSILQNTFFFIRELVFSIEELSEPEPDELAGFDHLKE